MEVLTTSVDSDAIMDGSNIHCEFTHNLMVCSTVVTDLSGKHICTVIICRLTGPEHLYLVFVMSVLSMSRHVLKSPVGLV